MHLRSPEQTIATIAVLGIILGFIVSFLRWLFAGPLTSDPWDQTITEAVDAPESLPVCHRCLTEHSSVVHFCPQCGAAVGDFNNMLPFEQLFSEGEVFRNGTLLKTPPTFLRVTGYFLLSLAAYSIFAPFYWFFLFRNFTQRELITMGEGEPPALPGAGE